MTLWSAAAGWYAAMSIIAFVAYARDKHAAILGQWRTPERTLHTLELLGGWPGALIAQRLLRHKTRDTGFLVVFRLIVALHALGWGAALWFTR